MCLMKFIVVSSLSREENEARMASPTENPRASSESLGIFWLILVAGRRQEISSPTPGLQAAKQLAAISCLCRGLVTLSLCVFGFRCHPRTQHSFLPHIPRRRSDEVAEEFLVSNKIRLGEVCFAVPMRTTRPRCSDQSRRPAFRTEHHHPGPLPIGCDESFEASAHAQPKRIRPRKETTKRFACHFECLSFVLHAQ